MSAEPDHVLRDLIGASGIGIRNTATLKLSEALKAQLSEFSVVSASTRDEILKSLYQSSEKADRKHFAQIAKNACIMGSLTKHKGPFKI